MPEYWLNSGTSGVTNRQITFVTSQIEPPLGDAVLDGTVLFVGMGTVRKATTILVGPQVPKESKDLFGNQVPVHELSQSRRVDDVAAERQFQKFRRRCRVGAFECVADFADSQIERRFHGVQQRRLADTALTENDAFPILQLQPQSVHTKTAPNAQRQDLVAHLGIGPDDRLQLGEIDEIDLVDTDNRTDFRLLRRDEHPVDQIRLEIRLRRAGNDQNLVDIGNENMFAVLTFP